MDGLLVQSSQDGRGQSTVATKDFAAGEVPHIASIKSSIYHLRSPYIGSYNKARKGDISTSSPHRDLDPSLIHLFSINIYI